MREQRVLQDLAQDGVARQLEGILRGEAAAFGLEVKAVGIRDIILPALPSSPMQPGVQGAIVRLAQVADVVDGAEEARSWSSMDGTSALNRRTFSSSRL